MNLIGRGYPSPTRTFRWCTDRLKITPAREEIAKITKQYGSCILLLGTRISESTTRKRSIEKRLFNEDGFSKHDDYPDTLIFSPIKQWNIDDVWGIFSRIDLLGARIIVSFLSCIQKLVLMSVNLLQI